MIIQRFINNEGIYEIEIPGLGNRVVMVAVRESAPDFLAGFAGGEQLGHVGGSVVVVSILVPLREIGGG